MQSSSQKYKTFRNAILAEARGEVVRYLYIVAQKTTLPEMKWRRFGPVARFSHGSTRTFPTGVIETATSGAAGKKIGRAAETIWYRRGMGRVVNGYPLRGVIFRARKI